MNSRPAALAYRICAFAAGLALSMALVAIATQVVMRYGVGRSLFWAEELARYALIWSVMFGTAAAYGTGSHVAMTVLIDLLPLPARRFFFRAIHLLVFLFGAILTWQGWGLAQRNFDRNQLSPALQIEIGWVYLAIPVGGLLLAAAALHALWTATPPGGRSGAT